MKKVEIFTIIFGSLLIISTALLTNFHKKVYQNSLIVENNDSTAVHTETVLIDQPQYDYKVVKDYVEIQYQNNQPVLIWYKNLPYTLDIRYVAEENEINLKGLY